MYALIVYRFTTEEKIDLSVTVHTFFQSRTFPQVLFQNLSTVTLWLKQYKTEIMVHHWVHTNKTCYILLSISNAVLFPLKIHFNNF